MSTADVFLWAIVVGLGLCAVIGFGAFVKIWVGFIPIMLGRDPLFSRAEGLAFFVLYTGVLLFVIGLVGYAFWGRVA